jgi:hypothetical protein
MSGWDPYLDAGETVLWQGKPSDRLFLLTRFDAIMIPFSIVWGGFALLWNLGVWAMGAPFFFKLFGLPFLIVGAYITVGRFFIDQRIRQNTVYALTTKRAFIATSAFGRNLRDKPIRLGTGIDFTPGPRASLTFDGASPVSTQMLKIGYWHGETGDFTFRAISDGDMVYRLARDIQQGTAT